MGKPISPTRRVPAGDDQRNIVQLLQARARQAVRAMTVIEGLVSSEAAFAVEMFRLSEFASKTRGMLSRGTKVEVEVDGGDANIVAGGKSVSETLVRDGYAYATPRRRRASDGEDYLGSALADAQEAAKRDQRGLWRPCDATSAPVVPVATFDDIDFQPTPTKDYGDAPTKYKSCAEFEFYEDALAIFERAPEGVRKRLDRDGDGVPCPGLPHTTDRERYRFKKRAEASSSVT